MRFVIVVVFLVIIQWMCTYKSMYNVHIYVLMYLHFVMHNYVTFNDNRKKN